MFNYINLNLYKVFYDVVKYGSFSKAAEFTYTTQSSISKSIKKLEEQLGIKLFYRNSHGVELTENGKELLYYVEQSYGNIMTAERLLMETDNLDRGKLNIGLPSYISSFFFFDKIKDFYKKYPNIEITLMNGSREYLLNLLNNHKIDFIIYSSPIFEKLGKDLELIKLYPIEYKFFCRKDKYENYKHIKDIKDLERVPLVLPVPGSNNRRFLDEILIKKDVKIKRAINIHTSEGILTAVKNDLGVGYIIEDIVKGDDTYKCINIKTKLHKEEVALIYNRKFLTKVPLRFIEEQLNIKIK
ncbi:MAG: LysR family transcriptional regulator [Clostridia bacterium]|nr:LysR family transcriptional regulator [Clostridia bacterium]